VLFRQANEDRRTSDNAQRGQSVVRSRSSITCTVMPRHDRSNVAAITEARYLDTINIHIMTSGNAMTHEDVGQFSSSC